MGSNFDAMGKILFLSGFAARTLQPWISRKGVMNSSSQTEAQLWKRTCDLPAGTLFILGTQKGVCAAAFDEQSAYARARHHFGPEAFEAVASPIADAAVRGLTAYAEGDGNALATIPIDVEGTPFQNEVWRALRALKMGETTTYSAIAGALGRTGAERAVGAANGKNPIAVIVPCHRVIGRDGSLVGYAFGLERKRALLVHEGALLA